MTFNHLVVGSSLPALCYAFLNNVPVVCTRLSPPWRLDHFDPQLDLSCFYFKNEVKTIATNTGTKKIGVEKFRLWEHLYFYLNLAGLFPAGDKINSLRVDEETLKAHTSNARMIKIDFDNLIIFDEDELYGLDLVPTFEPHEKLEVRDWFHVRSGMKHKFDCINDDSDFVSRICFYSSDRVDGEHNYKDAVSVSYLTDEMVKSFEFSDINARFKTLQVMKKHGIRGARNGRDQKNPTRFKFYAVKIENHKRVIVRPRNHFISYDKFLFNYKSIYDIMKTDNNGSYVRKIAEQLSRS
tara:strand:+ start:485 stop:1372 length:888 start_codon:yes stop_codon:yes gene_type:complete